MLAVEFFHMIFSQLRIPTSLSHLFVVRSADAGLTSVSRLRFSTKYANKGALIVSVRVPSCMLSSANRFVPNLERWLSRIMGVQRFNFILKNPSPSGYKYHCFYRYKPMGSILASNFLFFCYLIHIIENIVCCQKKNCNSEVVSVFYFHNVTPKIA